MLDSTAYDARRYNRTLERERREPDEESMMLAEDELLHDADSFSEWLMCLCAAYSAIDVGYVPTRREGSELSDSFYIRVQDTFSVPQLLVLALNHRAWADVAMARLADLFVQDNEARMQKRAMEIEE